jgi:hypothetical protein
LPFGRRQPNLFAVSDDPLGGKVDREVSGFDHRLLVDGDDPPESGPQPRQELVHPERLRDVVVGAGVEGGDLVGLGVANGQDDDRDPAPAADALDDLDAADAGKAEVDDDDVRRVTGSKFESFFTRLDEVDVEAAGPKVHFDGAPDLEFVVDDEDTAGHGP